MPVNTGVYSHDGLPVNQLLQDLVAAAAASLAQTPRGIPDVAGMWHDIPVEDCPDALFGWVQEWVPINIGQFPNLSTSVDRCSPLDLDPRLVLSLRRPCAPIPDERGNVDPADEGATAEDLIVDARALMCGVMATWPPILEANYPAARISYGSMTPTGANTNVFGYDWPVLLEINSCRAACSP